MLPRKRRHWTLIAPPLLDATIEISRVHWPEASNSRGWPKTIFPFPRPGASAARMA